MIIDCISDQSLWPQKVDLTQEESNAIAVLNPGDILNFRGIEYIFIGKFEKRAEWISLA